MEWVSSLRSSQSVLDTTKASFQSQQWSNVTVTAFGPNYAMTGLYNGPTKPFPYGYTVNQIG